MQLHREFVLEGWGAIANGVDKARCGVIEILYHER